MASEQLPILVIQGWLGYFPPDKRSEQAEDPILASWIFIVNGADES